MGWHTPSPGVCAPCLSTPPPTTATTTLRSFGDCTRLALVIAHPASTAAPRPLGGDTDSLALVHAHHALAFPPVTGGLDGGNSLALVVAHPALAPPPTPPPPPPDTGVCHMLSTGARKPCLIIPPVTGEGGDGTSLALVLARPALAPHASLGMVGTHPSPCAHTPCLTPTITTTTARHHPHPHHRTLGVVANA